MKLELDFDEKIVTVRDTPPEGVYYLALAAHMKDLLGEERMEWKIKFDQPESEDLQIDSDFNNIGSGGNNITSGGAITWSATTPSQSRSYTISGLQPGTSSYSTTASTAIPPPASGSNSFFDQVKRKTTELINKDTNTSDE